MGKKSILLIFSLLLVSGCSFIYDSNGLINDVGMIDKVSVGVYEDVNGEAVVEKEIEIVDPEQVGDFILLARGIDVEPLESLERAQDMIDHQDSYERTYEVTFTASSELTVDTISATKGFFFVLEEGKLVFTDPDTLAEPKVQCYITVDEQAEVIAQFEDIIQLQTTN